MAKLKIPYKFEPREYQVKLFQVMDGIKGVKGSKKLRAFIVWHRRAGKDLACINYMIKCMVSEPGIYYYVLPTYAQGRKVLWEGMYDGFRIISHIPEELIKRKNNQEMVVELHNNSIFRVIGSENIDSIRGTNPLGIVLSEYAWHSTEVWSVLSPILGMNEGWAIFNTTPRGPNHAYKLFNSAKNWKDWYIDIMTVKDSGLEAELQQTINHDRELYGEDFVQSEYYCSWSSGDRGAIYAHNIEQARTDKRIGAFPPDDHRWVDTFWDIGISDSTVIWFRQIIGGKQVWIDYYEESNKDIAYFVKVMKDKGYNYKTHYLPHDGAARKPTGMGYVTTTKELLQGCLKSAGLSQDVVICPRLPVQNGINGVRALFSRFYFNEGLCSDGIEKLALYHRRWDSKREVFVKEPVHDKNSHAADALRTVVVSEQFEEDEYNKNPLTILTEYDILG